MNKRELIERMEGLKNLFGNKPEYVETDTVIELISELDEPEKVTIPQFVADWIERSKQEKRNLRNALNNGGEKMRLWFLDQENYDLFARAWLEGYEVEEEKRYRVKAKGVIEYAECLKYGEGCRGWIFGMDNNFGNTRNAHTKKQLKDAGFGWVFDCPGIEIEEAPDVL